MAFRARSGTHTTAKSGRALIYAMLREVFAVEPEGIPFRFFRLRPAFPSMQNETRTPAVFSFLPVPYILSRAR